MKKPKLALIPATMGTKVFSVLPSDGTGDFDFTRASEATMINKDGLIQTVPSGQSRLEYPMIDGVVSGCPSLLLEPSRTNLIAYSEDFSGYTTANTTRVSNYGVSPTGALNAALMYPTSSASNVGIYTPSSSSTVGTLSCFVKSSGKDFALLGTDNNANYYCVFDLANETVVYEATNYEGKIEKYPNGWFRISSTYVSSTARIFPFIGVADNSGGTVIADGSNGILIFGLQYEYESYPTSYIPTNGTAVTRAAETANGAGDASTFNSSEGVLMAEISALTETTDIRVVSISDGTTSNMVFIRFDTLNRIIAEVAVLNGGSVNPLFIAPDITSFNKIALKWALNDVALWVNGIEVSTISVIGQFAPNTLNVMNLSMPSTASRMYSKTKQLQYFQTALTDSELEELTSWDSFVVMAIAQLYTIE